MLMRGSYITLLSLLHTSTGCSQTRMPDNQLCTAKASHFSTKVLIYAFKKQLST